MFARSNRFSFKNGMPKRNFSAQFFVLRYDLHAEKLQCAVVVGKKVDKRAVERNRIKRQVVAIIKEVVPVTTPVRVVVIARPSIKTANQLSIREELIKTFQLTLII